MGRVSFLFSGQGAQYPGMGKEFYNRDKDVFNLFNNAEELLPGTLEMMFNGSDEELKRTDITQPLLYLADLASAIALRNSGIQPYSVAGFSLGEIPALAFSNAYSYIDGFSIACKRGKVMQKAALTTDASMAAIVKLDNSTVESICGLYENVYPVNYNCKGQLVVSGVKNQLALFYEDIKKAGGRAIPLKVGGGFHSPFMDSASEEFSLVLQEYDIKNPMINTYSNRTADLYSKDSDMKMLLKEQINHAVKWESIITKMIESGTEIFIETGVGAVLSKLVTKIDPQCKTYSCSDYSQLQNIISELK